MSDKRNELISGLYLTGLLVLVTGLPLSMFLMSVGQMIMLASWLLDGRLINKIKTFFINPVTLILASVFFMHLIGLLWTDDFSYAMKDLRIKLPLLLLPLIIYTSGPLSEKKFNLILYVFIGAVVAASLICTAVLLGFSDREVNDIRDISIFISHIRFALLICIAIFCLASLYFKNRETDHAGYKILLVLTACWLIAFLVILEALTGLFILVSAGFLTGIVLAFRHPRPVFKFLILIPLVLFALLFYRVNRISNEVNIYVKADFSQLDTTTALGNHYLHERVSDDTENGNPIWIYICPPEIDSTWPTRSSMSVKGKDNKGQILYFTLIRYLSSKGLRKDAAGINSLTQADIKAIEDGNTNYRFTDLSDLNARLFQIVWEYYHYRTFGNPAGHSVMQRLEFWKTGWNIFLQNPVKGVGTGDVQASFNSQYEHQHTKLRKEWWLRAHNQYLTFALTFGIFGLCLFLLSLFYPWFKLNMKASFLYSLFLLTSLLSFFTEDTLETQAGVTFYAFFNAFFLFGKARSE